MKKYVIGNCDKCRKAGIERKAVAKIGKIKHCCFCVCDMALHDYAVEKLKLKNGEITDFKEGIMQAMVHGFIYEIDEKFKATAGLQ